MHTLLKAMEQRLATNWRRPVALLSLCALVALLLSVDSAYALMQQLLSAAKPVIEAHPYLGCALFVVLSAVSAMLAFFSSALLVPIAVYNWGTPATIALLWLGWLLGGMCAFWIGRSLRRPMVHSPRTARLVTFYSERVPPDTQFPIILLLQLALPSEVPGYLCGLLGVRFRIYASALALAELPFAVGTVLLGESILQRQEWWLVVLGVAGAGLILCAAFALHKRLGR